MADEERDPSLPQPMPGQGDCPDGYRLASKPTQPDAVRECVPVGPKVPIGGWKPSAPGYGAGYPPTAKEAFNALASVVLGDRLPWR